MILPFAALSHPAIDPVLIQIGPLQIHWYGIAYIVGIMFGWWYARKLAIRDSLWGKAGSPISAADFDDFLIWAVAGIILGGRIGYVLFYDLQTYLSNPLSIAAVWKGGMSFHGGLAGIILAMILFARRRDFSSFSLFDVIAASCGVGLFLGRVANFINAELYGKITNVAWGVVFPGTNGQPRHPSQLYEAVLEGLLLFVLLAVLTWSFKKLRQPGFIGGAFLVGYGISRIIVEFFRVPDPQLGYLVAGWVTMGMVLSLPVILLGVWTMMTARSRASFT